MRTDDAGDDMTDISKIIVCDGDMELVIDHDSDGWWLGDVSELGLSACGRSLDDLLDSIDEYVRFMHREFVDCPIDDLDTLAQMLREVLLPSSFARFVV
jgi:hypothetical protein